MTRFKKDIVAEIAQLLGVPAPPMSTGSTEPKEIFILVSRELGLGLDTTLSKPQLARAIVEADGLAWGAKDESRGGTVTTDGLDKVAKVVRRLLQ